MQFILKVPEKSVPEFNVEIHGWVPTHIIHILIFSSTRHCTTLQRTEDPTPAMSASSHSDAASEGAASEQFAAPLTELVPLPCLGIRASITIRQNLDNADITDLSDLLNSM
ncbi:hypothetical protein AMECASPLE_024080 [Ameca splendens]|uniref:Uncharacterized protein n=1 Tax=Ameca splendens TaxID=208324 RepID=A0ABV0ZZV1_9TELE